METAGRMPGHGGSEQPVPRRTANRSRANLRRITRSAVRLSSATPAAMCWSAGATSWRHGERSWAPGPPILRYASVRASGLALR